jgi:hypothetical protein
MAAWLGDRRKGFPQFVYCRGAGICFIKKDSYLRSDACISKAFPDGSALLFCRIPQDAKEALSKKNSMLT